MILFLANNSIRSSKTGAAYAAFMMGVLGFMGSLIIDSDYSILIIPIIFSIVGALYGVIMGFVAQLIRRGIYKMIFVAILFGLMGLLAGPGAAATFAIIGVIFSFILSFIARIIARQFYLPKKHSQTSP